MQCDGTRFRSQRTKVDHVAGSAGDNLLQEIVFIDNVAIIDTQVVEGALAVEGAGNGNHGVNI